MTKTINFLICFYFILGSNLLACRTKGIQGNFIEIEYDVSNLTKIVTKLQSCFNDFSDKNLLSTQIVKAFKNLDHNIKKDGNQSAFLDDFVKKICEEKEGVIGIFSVNAIQEKYINPVFIDFFRKFNEKSWENCFREVCTLKDQEYFEIFKLPYHQLLLKFFFDQGISRDFLFIKKNLYEALVLHSGDSLLFSLKLFHKQEYGLKKN